MVELSVIVRVTVMVPYGRYVVGDTGGLIAGIDVGITEAAGLGIRDGDVVGNSGEGIAVGDSQGFQAGILVRNDVGEMVGRKVGLIDGVLLGSSGVGGCVEDGDGGAEGT